jgi:alpha-D-xyloside xylohydrolase
MALAFPKDRAAWAFEDQFMFGPSLLVAPCYRPDGSVTVYLPEGDWRRFPDGAAFEGGQVHSLTLALDEMAVFAPAGVHIPLGPEVQHTDELGGAWPVEHYWPDEAG